MQDARGIGNGPGLPEIVRRVLDGGRVHAVLQDGLWAAEDAGGRVLCTALPYWPGEDDEGLRARIRRAQDRRSGQ